LLEKIISGGQTGADQAGLKAGKLLGLQTGGTAPWNWMTQKGPQEALLKSYGLAAGPKDPRTYPMRTRLNVQNSDGTVWFGDLSSPGGRLTHRCANECNPQKPMKVNPNSKELMEWIVEHQIKVLNVAGNREEKNPGITQRTICIIVNAVKGWTP